MKPSLAVVVSLLLHLSGCCESPLQVRYENRTPTILSLSVFPQAVGPSDSLVVVCHAIDPDNDTLVYDWITDGVVRISGALDDDHSLYNTFENSRVFFAPESAFVASPRDTFWVQCFARDRRGRSGDRVVLFTVVRQ